MLEIYKDGDVVIVDKKIFNLYKNKINHDKWKHNVITIKATEEQKSFLFILSNQLDGGKINKNNTVRNVNEIVGADNKSIICFNSSSISIFFYRGPDIPPSFLILQK